MADDPPETPPELADAGVELTEPVVTPKEPPRASFEVKDEIARSTEDLKPDLKIDVGGVVMRERISRLETLADGVVTSAPTVAPTTIVLGISHALLDAEGKVARDAEGGVVLATAYTTTLTAEGLGRIAQTAREQGVEPEKALADVLLADREKAAFQARREFDGMALAAKLGI